MHSLPSWGTPWAGMAMTIQLCPVRARARMAVLIGVIVLLTGQIPLYAQSRMATSSLVLQVRPEELLQVQNDSVVLKIRLARGTMAQLWAAESCTSPSPESQVIIASGKYTIPLNTLTPVSSNTTATTGQVCLASSDGVLNDSRPVEIVGTGNGAPVEGRTPPLAPGGVSVDVPDGWTVTTRAGTMTWSNP